MKAIYAGTFDPFTNGHLDVLIQSHKLFDTVYLLFAVNNQKERKYPLLKMVEAVRKTLNDNNLRNVDILYHSGLVAEYAKNLGVEYLIRGIRNPNDYNYEENIAKINKEINPKLKTVYFRAENDYISSSMINELLSYGYNGVLEYVSNHVWRLIRYGD